MPSRRGGQSRNDNAWKNRRGKYPRLAPQPSWSGKALESFMTKLASELGHEPSEDEAKAKAKFLCFKAFDEYIGS